MRFPVPVGESDPLLRLRHLQQRAWAARHEPSLPHTDTIAGILNLFPSRVIAGMLSHVDVVASDVPGFTEAVWLAGAKVGGYTAFGPTAGAAANITLVSYCGTCSVGVTLDDAAVADPDIFAACLAEGFDEVLALEKATPGAPAGLSTSPSRRRR